MSVLDNSILVLDRNFRPCGISSARKMIPLICVNKGRIVDENFNQHSFEDWLVYSEIYLNETGDDSKLCVKSPSVRFIVPDVVLIPDFVRNEKKHKKVRFSRSNVFKRDQYVCQYCTKKFSSNQLTIDHVIPKCKGGPKNWTNIVTACKKCNMKKADRTPEEANMPLLNNPVIPTWKNQIELLRGKNPLWEKLL